MTATNTSTSPTSPSAGAEPAALLQALKDELADELARQEKLTKNNIALREDIFALEKGGQELNQALVSYGQAYESQRKDEQDLTDDWKAKQEVVDITMGPKKTAIDEVIKKYDDNIEAKKKANAGLQKQKEEADTRLAKVKADLQAKQESFDKIRGYSACLTQKFNEIKNLRKQLEVAESQKQPATVYFLLTEIKKVLDSNQVISPEHFGSELTTAWTELKNAKDEVRKKKSVADDASAEVKKGADEVADLIAKRANNIMASLFKFNTPAVNPVPGGPP